MGLPGESPSSNGANDVRAGSLALSFFENPLNLRVLRAHVAGPLRHAELQGQVAWSAETTLRVAVNGLREAGALGKRQVASSPYAVATYLTEAGEGLLAVADVLEGWLARRPDGPIRPDGEQAKGAIKALAGGWSSTLIRALASGPSTLTELNRVIPDISYPALERRLSWMRSTGQIEPLQKRERGTPYVATDWLRRAIAPLCAAGRWERRHLPEQSGPITSIEVEAAFLLALPLAPLPPDATGTCMFGAQVEPTPEGAGPGIAGAIVEVAQGQIVSTMAAISSAPSSWAVGTPEAWLDAVIDGCFESLRIGGVDAQLPADLINGIHFALFTDR